MIRFVENQDWVAISLFVCIVALVFSFLSLNREATIREYLTQKTEDASNVFLSWVVVSVVYCWLLSVLLSQFVPILPKPVETFSLFGYSLNKIGYTSLVVGGFYLIKTSLTFLFFSSVNQVKRFNNLFFTASRFYFVLSLVVMVLVFLNYYFLTERMSLLYYLLLFLGLVLIFKVFLYLFSKNKTLPKEWYYKILYICTLQILPILAIWKLLFYI